MLSFLPAPVLGVLSLLLYTVNSLCFGFIIMSMAVVKLLTPFKKGRLALGRVMQSLAQTWVRINSINLSLTKRIHWDIKGVEDLRPNKWYLVLSNHQSWVDILVLQKVFHKRIPFLKFFIKKELIWMPVLGQTWWAMDFPFMKRYSPAKLKKHPHLKGKDLEITRKACEKFKDIPVAVMNFVEGTRFTKAKKEKQGSPYEYLLRPKAGGVATVLDAMGHQLDAILNVTVSYQGAKTSFWNFLCGRVRDIRVRVESIPVGPELLGDYFNDGEFREKFQEWLNSVWAEKDRTLALPARTLESF